MPQSITNASTGRQVLVGRKAIVTERAIIQRINRKLADDDLVLKTTRGANLQRSVGAHYVIDVQRNFITNTHIDPETYARELGVLAHWEEVAAS